MSLYIFDKDLTLVGSTTGKPPSRVEEQPLLPNVSEVCSDLRRDKHVLAIASNQGGVAWGFITLEQAKELVEDAAHKIGAADYEVCPNDPRGRVAPYNQPSDDRKPGPGMILKLMERLGYSKQDTIFIGDSKSDEEAAINAGVRFIYADKFFRFDEQYPFDAPDMAANG